MQSEPTAVSQRSSAAKPSSEEPLKSTQHGNDFCGDDRQVCGSLRPESVGPGAAQDGGGSPLNEAAPSAPVNRDTEFGYVNHMGSSLASSPEVESGFGLVTSSGRNAVSFEDFPNGTSRGVSRLSTLECRSLSDNI